MAEGIRKINEYVLQPGRALTVTDVLIKPEELPDGSLYVNPESGDFRYKPKDGTEYTSFTPGNIFKTKSISKAYIVDETLTDSQIQKNTITNECLKDKTVNTDKIKDGAVLSRLIAEKNVLNRHLADGAITEDKLAENAVTDISLKNGAVTHEKLAKDAVWGDVIKPGGITGLEIGAKAIYSYHIQTKGINGENLQDWCLAARHFTQECVATEALQWAAVTEPKIAQNAVTESKLANSAVTYYKVANNAIGTVHLIDQAVTNNKIAAGTIETTRLKAGTIALDRLNATVQKAINTAIKLSDNGIATVGGSLSVTGNATVRGDITANRVYNAVYNDLAEGYVPGEDLLPGDIVEIREDGKVYKSTPLSSRIVGVVSEEYAHCFGASQEELQAGLKVPVALVGKVHTKIKGAITQGDYVLSNIDGTGSRSASKGERGIVGKALETKTDNGVGKVLCLIFPN